LAIASSGADHVLLLHQRERMKEELRMLRERFGSHVSERPLDFGDLPSEVRQVKEELDGFIRGVPEDKLAIDLTPAFKSLTVALLEAAPPECWLMYCRHDYTTDGGVPDVRSVAYEVWRKGRPV
jgi:hypothetical protein